MGDFWMVMAMGNKSKMQLGMLHSLSEMMAIEKLKEELALTIATQQNLSA
ncbi:MAG: hypothetical protein ACYS5F_13890 [Planctomycetota bacterium]